MNLSYRNKLAAIWPLLIALLFILPLLGSADTPKGKFVPLGETFYDYSFTGIQAIRLNNGKVLIVGSASHLTGIKGKNQRVYYTQEAELYNPATRQFEPAGKPLSTLFLSKSIKVFLLPDGRVLLFDSKSAEIYDPATKAFQAAGTLRIGRHNAALHLLKDGRVLVIGGSTTYQAQKQLAEILAGGKKKPQKSVDTRIETVNLNDPSSPVKSLSQRLEETQAEIEHQKKEREKRHEVVILKTSAEIFDPTTGKSFFMNPSKIQPTEFDYHTVSLASEEPIIEFDKGATELYDPVAGKWHRLEGVDKSFVLAKKLKENKILILGKTDRKKTGSAISVEIFDLTRETLTLIGYTKAVKGSIHKNFTATLLQDGQILIAGGFVTPPPLFAFDNPVPYPVDTAEIINPETGSIQTISKMNQARAGHHAILLNDGTVLLVGGRSKTHSFEQQAELYIPEGHPLLK